MAAAAQLSDVASYAVVGGEGFALKVEEECSEVGTGGCGVEVNAEAPEATADDIEGIGIEGVARGLIKGDHISLVRLG